MANNQLRDVCPSLLHMHNVRRLRLRIGDNNLTTTAVGRLGHNLAVMPRLEVLELSLSGMMLGDRGVRALGGGLFRNPALRRLDLDLSECALGTQAAAHLGLLSRKNTTLRYLRLNLSGNAFLDGIGWEPLCRALEMTALEELHFVVCETTGTNCPSAVVRFVDGVRRAVVRRAQSLRTARLRWLSLGLACTNSDDTLLEAFASDWRGLPAVERLGIYVQGNPNFTTAGAVAFVQLLGLDAHPTHESSLRFLDLSINRYGWTDVAVNLSAPMLRSAAALQTLAHRLVFH